MTVGAVSANNDNAVTGNTQHPVQTDASGALAFSEVLGATSARTDGKAGGSADLDAIFEAAGLKYDLPPNLLKAVAKVESGFRANVTSTAGAMGIMQLMPGTAAGLGVTDAFDPEQNIMGGAKYLRQMLDRFDGDLRLALGAYNAGPGAVAKHGGVPSYSRNYVSKVLGYYDGGDITAGIVTYNGLGSSDGGGRSGLFNFSESFAQMLLIKIIEMQMKSSDDDRR